MTITQIKIQVPNQNSTGYLKLWVYDENKVVSDSCTITVNAIFVCHHVYGSWTTRASGLKAYRGKLGYWYDRYCNMCGYKLDHYFVS